MKHLTAIFLMILCLITFSSCAEDQPALFPIRESGLWGYMNRAGEVVIEPQWIHAWPFDGNTALVSTEKIPSYVDPYGNGIIDKNGLYLVEPWDGLVIENEEYIYRIRDDRMDSEGFLDKASSFYFPPQPEFRWVIDRFSDGQGPIAVETKNGHTGYLDRSTGEVTLPFQYEAFLEDDVGNFVNGYARISTSLVWTDDGENELETDPVYQLIDLQGNISSFPDDIMPVSSVYGDRVVIMAVGEKGRRLFKYGLAKPDGTVISEPSEDYIYIWPPDDEGMVCFMSEDGLLGHMNRDGQIIVPPTYGIDGAIWLPYWFYNGYAVIEDSVTERWVVIDTQGYEVFSHPMETEDGEEFRLDDHVLDDGWLWYQLDENWGLFVIVGEYAAHLTDAVFEDRFGGVITDEEYKTRKDFAEGLQQVKQNGLWGYINRFAQWVIEPRYDNASSFRDGLALVEKDGKLLYIDHDGNVVWQEK